MRPRWWARLLGEPVPYGCDHCDDTGISEYHYDHPWYCIWCEKGIQLERERRRQERIKGMERDVLK